MGSHRRHGSARLLLPAAFVASVAVQAGGLLLWDALHPPPPPMVRIKAVGEGAGTVLSTPAGIACDAESRKRGGCMARFEPGTRLKFLAVVGEGSTFGGWTGCEASDKNALECTLIVQGDTTVSPEFGKVPDRVDVAWVKLDPPKPEDTKDDLKVSLPDPKQEAKLLARRIPVKELLKPLPKPKPEPPKVQPPKPKPQPKVVVPLPKPKPKVAVAPKPKPKKRRPPPQKMTSVEVPDENEVDKAPDDARHLSDKNRDVKVETHAKDTNLEKARKGKTVASSKSDVKSEDIGGKETKIAQLEDTDPTDLDADRGKESVKAGTKDKATGVLKGDDGQDGDDGQKGDFKKPKPGILSMRGIEGRGPPGGPVVVPEHDHDKHKHSGKRGRVGKRGRRGIKTSLSFQDYERIVGKDKVRKEVALGRRRQSKRRGRYARKLAAIKSSLENFVPHVRPGNQTALKTRAAPFAVYIARMHRRIHELWGFGFLEDLSNKSSTNPLNNWKLQTIIEIVINPDGSVHKTTIVEPSGLLTFDVAALDTVYTGGPYSEPPKKIRSPDGRTYMHWVFRRDWQQCGTFNVRPFILDKAPSGSRIDDGKLVARSKARHAAKRRMIARRNAAIKSSSKANTAAHTNLASPSDPRAQHAANLWLTGFTKGDVGKMTRVSNSRFKSGDAVVANTPTEVSAVYRTILRETKRRGIRQYKLVTPAGFRKRFGALPPGVQSGKGLVLLVVQLYKERFVVSLERTAGGDYRATGFHR